MTSIESQGYQLIRDIYRMTRKGKEVVSQLSDIQGSLKQQLQLLDGDIGAWKSMLELDLEGLCAYEVISSIEMYHDYKHFMINKE